jgi:endo-1,4-beta-xylanase
MRRRRAGLAALAALLILAAAVVADGCGDAGGEPNAKVPLRALAQRAGIAIGTAVDANALAHKDGYRTEVAREFSSVTPENVMKWEVTEPERGKFDFDDADRIVDFARDHDMRVRGHTLVWHIQNPQWLREGRFSRPELIEILREHITKVVGRYRGRVASWDVVNEAMRDDGTLRPSLWLQRIGPEYIALAFHFAHKADPAATLFYNEIGAEGDSDKSNAVYRMLKALREGGVPVGGIGFEGHLNLEGPPPTFRRTMERFAKLGLQVAVTEADVRVKLPPSPSELHVQADSFADALRDCLGVGACRSFTFWGFTDRYSWIPENQPGFGAATLLDDQLNPKPAYRAVHRVLAAR